MNEHRRWRVVAWLLGVLALLLIAVAVGYGLGRRSASPSDRTTSGSQWVCSMHPEVRQGTAGKCPICRMELTPSLATAPTGAPLRAAPSGTRTIKFWWDPAINPPHIADQPGKSPSGADLVPVYEEEVGAIGSDVVIDAGVIQRMGVRTARVTEGPLKRSVRVFGSLEEAQPNIHDVSLRVSGWVKQVIVSFEGQHVEAGDPLFELYSPELTLAIEELIAARKGTTPGGTSGFDAAARRLEFLGLDKPQIDALSKLEKAPDNVIFRAPITGHVTEMPIVEGMAVKAGERVLRMVDHTMLWIDAQVFEKDLPFLKVGAKASASIASRPRNVYDGQVVFIHPHVNMDTRAVLVRMEVRNAGLALKPGMHATVRIDTVGVERAVMAPREAIIDSGETQVALVAKERGRFEPRRVKVGLVGNDGMVQVVAGLAAGEEVVTSGQFLIDSESRLREAVQRFGSVDVAPPPATSAPTASVAASARLLPSLDGVVRAYLDIAEVLGAEQVRPTPVELQPLIAAAQTLIKEASGSPQRIAAVAVAELAEVMRRQNIEQQRESFKKLSESLIQLVEATPPSRAVGEKLHVMECPMAPGRWIQRTDELANPFYATDMKECGSHVKVILAGEKGTTP